MFVVGLALVGGLAEALMAHAFRDPAAEKYALLYAGGTPPGTQLWGTSHVTHGVSPCLLGDDVWNVAFDAATPTFYQAWYAEWRRHNAAPKRVWLGLDALVFKRLPWVRRPAQDSGYWPWARLREVVGRGGEEARTALLNRAALVRHREALQDVLVKPGASLYALAWDQACRGFVPFAPRAHAAASWAERQDPAGMYAAHPEEPTYAAALQALLDALRADGVAVAAFQAPYLHAVQGEDARTNAALARLLAARGIPFLDYNTGPDAGFRERLALFADVTHLNAEGAERFSRRLAADLSARRLR